MKLYATIVKTDEMSEIQSFQCFPSSADIKSDETHVVVDASDVPVDFFEHWQLYEVREGQILLSGSKI